MIIKFPDNPIISIIGDIHLNLRTKEYEAWERARFLALFTTVAEDASTIVFLNGDTFDKAQATLQEIGLLYEGINILRGAGKEVYITDGNHEEIDRETTTFDLLPHDGYTRIKVNCFEAASTYVWLVGHPHINFITAEHFPIMTDKKNVLVSHYRSDIGVAAEEIDNSLVSTRFDDTILSDIHYRLVPADNIRYTSSPYGIHFSPAKDYGYCMLHITDEGYEIEDITLNLPSKEKVICKEAELQDTLDSLDDANIHKLEIIGDSSSESLLALRASPSVSKFSFTETTKSSDVGDITDELLVTMHNSVEEVIVVALSDLELTDEEMERAKKIIQEEL